MPYWIEGWIEATWTRDIEQNEDYSWQSVINLSTLIDGPDEVSERLFGLSKRCTGGEVTIETLAANRGVPLNPSLELKTDLERIIEHEKKFGPGECGGYTHATWQEIKGVALEEETLRKSDWKLVFDLVHQLGQKRHYSDVPYRSDDQIRFVVWFNW